MYTDRNCSNSYPLCLSAKSAYRYSATVHRELSDDIHYERAPSSALTDRHRYAIATSHSAVDDSSNGTHSQRLQQVKADVDEPVSTDIGCPGVVGIKNHGNTCFASSVIQCLSNTEHFTEHFVNDRHRSRLVASIQSGRECAVTEGLAQLIESLWTRAYTSKLSQRLLKAVWRNTDLFADSDGHDAEEFLLWLLNTINDELYGSVQQDDSKQVAVCLYLQFRCRLFCSKNCIQFL